jgi:hypothetical protein
MAAEKNFENRLKTFLESEGCWFVKFFANAYTKSGIPDLLVCCNGYFVAVEVKAPNGKPSELQKMNIRKINKEQGYGIVLYPDQFDNFKDIIRYLKHGNSFYARQTLLKINERWDK